MAQPGHQVILIFGESTVSISGQRQHADVATAAGDRDRDGANPCFVAGEGAQVDLASCAGKPHRQAGLDGLAHDRAVERQVGQSRAGGICKPAHADQFQSALIWIEQVYRSGRQLQMPQEQSERLT